MTEAEGGAGVYFADDADLQAFLAEPGRVHFVFSLENVSGHPVYGKRKAKPT